VVVTQIEWEPTEIVHDLKRQNLRNLMLFLLSCGEMTKLDLLQQTGLSATTVSDAINSLQTAGIIRKTGTQKSTGGRQPSVYSINSGYGTFLGIQVESHRLSLTGTDMYAQPVYRREAYVEDARHILYTLYDLIDEAVAALPGPVLALAVGMSGRLDVQKGIVLSSEFLNWRNVPIKEILERRYKVLTVLDSKINQGTVYQQVLGSAQQVKNFACYFSAIPDRVALVLGGRLYYGDENECVYLGGDEPLERLKLLMGMLNINVAVTDVDEALPGRQRIPIALREGYFETAAALTAEAAWFGQIYYIQTKKDNKKGGAK
jgi:predicted transcriptional regulator